MDRFFIARKYIFIDGGAKHIYEESVFNTYEMAFNFIKFVSEEEDDAFLSEIIDYSLNSFDSCDDNIVYTFDKEGNLVHKYIAQDRNLDCTIIEKNGHKRFFRKHEPESFTGKYRIGDIVFIRAFPWNEFSPTYLDTIGVISFIPLSFNDWVLNGNDDYMWDNSYVIDCIRDGYFGHFHVEESGIDHFNGETPDNLEFLSILSEHYKMKKLIPKNIFNDILNGNIFIEKVKHYNFEFGGH